MGRKNRGKRRKCWLPAFSCFPTIFSKGHILSRKKSGLCDLQQQILDSSNQKEFADDNFDFDENDILEFSKRAENTVGTGEIALYEHILHFP